MRSLEEIRNDFPILNRKVYDKPLVYLDNAATTLKPQVVIDEIVKYSTRFVGEVDNYNMLGKYDINLHAEHFLVPVLNSVFDFDKMTYRFLSNYLGAKWNREEIFADTPVGPLKDFMEASFAEMILPVARGMEHRFRYFMLTNGMIFEGEDVPVIDDEVSLSILEELNDDPSLLEEEAAIVSVDYLKLPSPHIMLMQDADIGRIDYTDDTKKPIPTTTIGPIKGESDVETE